MLPGWLSVWLLHYDHHLEHHIRPRLPWYALPELRGRLAREPGLTLHRVSLPQFFLEVFLTRSYDFEAATETPPHMEASRVYHEITAA